MKELMTSPYFGVGLSVVAFWIGEKLHSKLKTPICNPLIVAIVLIVGVLLIFDIPYDSYDVGGALINMFLAPATACLAKFTMRCMLRQTRLTQPPFRVLPRALRLSVREKLPTLLLP